MVDQPSAPDQRPWYLHPITPIVMVFIIICLQVAWYVFALFIAPPSDDHPLSTGEFGDLFGGFGSLISGLALTFIVYSIFQQAYNLGLQRTALEAQRNELTLTREELKLTREELKLTRDEARLAREYRAQPTLFINIEDDPKRHYLEFPFKLTNNSNDIAWEISILAGHPPTSLKEHHKRCPALLPGQHYSFTILKDPDLQGRPLWVSVRYRNPTGGRFLALFGYHNPPRAPLELLYYRVMQGDGIHKESFKTLVAKTGFRMPAEVPEIANDPGTEE